MSSSTGSNVAVQVQNISKVYRLHDYQGSLREALSSGFFRNRNGNHKNQAASMLWALDNLSFEVGAGEALGIIGPNGAGKTTTLKILSRVVQPTSGSFQVNGRMAALIELGAGFHPDLTGRENIYLNGSILGLSRREISRQFDRIVSFSELERFIDTPVKRYSSGMYVRLGFAVAAHTNPDVLLVDEVLAVGDAGFRNKCMAYIAHLQEKGAAILLVSHNTHQIVQVCDRAILLNKGKIHTQGDPYEVVLDYESLQRQHLVQVPQNRVGAEEFQSGQSVLVSGVTLSDIHHSNDREQYEFTSNSSVTISFKYQTLSPLLSPIIRVRAVRVDGVTCFMLDTKDPRCGVYLDRLEGEGEVRLAVEPLQLTGGAYFVEARILDVTNSLLLGIGRSDTFIVRGSHVTEVVSGIFMPLQATWTHCSLPVAAGKNASEVRR